MTSLLGLFVFVAIAFALSRSRKNIPWKMVGLSLGLQLILALLVIGIPRLGLSGPLEFLFSFANTSVQAILNFTLEGSRFLFGELLNTEKIGYIFAFQVLPTIIFMGSLMSLFYHLGVMQKLVHGIAKVMQKTLRTSGAESLAAAANVFVGQTEAPLVVKPYISRMTESELFSLMVGGMATVAGGVLAAYVGLLNEKVPEIAGHLLTASLMSAPAALAIAKILIPETGTPVTKTMVPLQSSEKKLHENSIEAVAAGASEGLSLALNVAAMLLAFIALIALLNAGLGLFGEWIYFENWGPSLEGLPQGKLSFELILGYLFSPLAFAMGIPWDECFLAGRFLGEKIVLNEFIAYLNLAEQGQALSERSTLILSYALCGFANFSSIAIQIGGIGGIAPERKRDLARMGILSVIGGSLAAFMTASLAGLLL